MAFLSGSNVPGGMFVPVAVGAVTLALLLTAAGFAFVAEALRLRRMAVDERLHEYECGVRPRL